MALHTPYPTTCNIWAPQVPPAYGTGPMGAAAVTNVPCFIQPERHMDIPHNTPAPASRRRIIYMAKGTDVRLDLSNATNAFIEAPAGSQTYYRVIDVVDWNKGTSIEERSAVCLPQAFAAPIP